ncbi:MAG: CRISPR-associated helicase Cas3' [Synergistaceae bacterium]|nr:CRISPR-associated helicase Cas3' [Synergistaceae bacterium]MBP9625848.1 CRISPR-associated helicase Cas3' [Synergistaceae bacterium]
MQTSDRAYIAHVRQEPDGQWKEHTWEEHSADVASFASEFAAILGNADWGEFVGWLHDTGKLHIGWQSYIRKQTGYDQDAFIENKDPRGNHSTLGAVAVFNRKLDPICKKIIAYIIAGHHAGLPDWETTNEGMGESLRLRLFEAENQEKLKVEELRKLDALVGQKFKNLLLERPFPKTQPLVQQPSPKNYEALSLWVRMLFSCLVDADYLDTERFMDSDKFSERGNYSTIKELKNVFDDYMNEKTRSVEESDINLLRSKILSSCRNKAILPPGFFTLSVPTGAGKTLASMAFALEHALKHHKKRVIMAIPYTSIIEQTAKVYKYGTDDLGKIENGAVLFGDTNVIEHHSNLDPSKETLKSRLACENWDAPIIVTTNVQLFESLAGSRPSVCRKLHNIADSVIILDEAQLLPPEFLKSILTTLNHLVESFGVTVLLCTATQPALEGEIGTGTVQFCGLNGCVELAGEDRDGMMSRFKRVQFLLPKNSDEKYASWEPLAADLCSHESVLCVVNTRKCARNLHVLMPEGTRHLSGLMCAEDRSFVISRVKDDLKARKPIRLISTQLIEAGVDIDFPVVYRAYAGLDSLVQAAGRCNREGRLNEMGTVFVFNPPKLSPAGLLRKGEDAARLILRDRSSFELSDALFEKYFKQYYSVVNDFDKPKFKDRMLKGIQQGEFQFRTYAGAYRMIDDSAQRSIIVPYENEETGKSSYPLIAELEGKWGWRRSLFRELQRFTVTVPERIFSEMYAKGYVRLSGEGGHAVLNVMELYKPGIGLILDDPKWEGALIV